MDTDEREQVDMDYAADEEGGEKARVDAQSNDKKVFVPPNDKKRVKVYELRKNDWYDRGTGYCTGRVVNVRDSRLALCDRVLYCSWERGFVQ